MGKTCILALTLVVFGAPRLAAAESEKEAVAAIEELAANVQLGWKEKRCAPKGVTALRGVKVRWKKIEGDDLRHLAALKDLESLIFFTVTIKGEGLKHLKDL